MHGNRDDETSTNGHWLSDITPAEQVHFARTSNTEQIDRFLTRLARAYGDVVEHRELGLTGQGQPIHGLRIGHPSNDDAARLDVMLYAQQHGNEPAGMEAALLLARDLASGSLRSLLDNLTVWLVPQVNPDGASLGQRRTSNDVDLNRHHHLLAEPELEALIQFFREVMPPVTVDVHEQGMLRDKHFIPDGAIADYDLMADGPTNPNSHPDVRAIADRALHAVESGLNADGYKYRRYVPISSEGPLALIPRYSNLGVYGGREYPTIWGTLAFITETMRFPEESSRLERRARSTYSALVSMLRFFATHKTEIQDAVTEERTRIAKKVGEPVVVRAEYQLEPQDPPFEYAYLQTRDGSSGVAQFDEAATEVRTHVERDLPAAYWIDLEPGDSRYQAIRSLLEKHAIEVEDLADGITTRVESYRIDRFDRDDWRANRIDVTVENREVPKGALLVPGDQLGANLAAFLLEPESMNGVILTDILPGSSGMDWPVRRVMETRNGMVRQG